MKHSKSVLIVPALIAMIAGCSSQPAISPAPSGTGTSEAITEADLRQRLYAYADDSMLGREAGTIGNFKATTYIAGQVRRMGLEPAGENGTYFQVVPLSRVDVTPGTSLSAGGRTFELWTDYFPMAPGFNLPIGMQGKVSGVPVVYGGILGDTANMIGAEAAEGKVVILAAQQAANGARRFSVSRSSMERFAGASVVMIANLDVMPAAFSEPLKTPRTSLKEEAGATGPDGPLVIFVTPEVAEAALGAPADSLTAGAQGAGFQGNVGFTVGPAEAPARNVVAIVRGTDPALARQYVAIGSHNDHVGLASEPVEHDSLRAYLTVIQPGGAEDQPREPAAEEAERIQAILDSLRAIRPPRMDSVYNGADDDASGTVTTLEIAEAFAADPPKRSLLFVWHTGEEKGLWGSQYYTDHPTVPRDSIVAQLNMDMVGRGNASDVAGGGPGYLQLIGSRRLSTELGDIVEAVNTEGNFGFTFDYTYDADGHPANYYCRSDHYMYARYGIPIVFFTTGSHRDYHQLTDEAQYINYPKMTRVAKLVHAIAERVANLDHRPVVDKPKPDPQGECRQ